MKKIGNLALFFIIVSALNMIIFSIVNYYYVMPMELILPLSIGQTVGFGIVNKDI